MKSEWKIKQEIYQCLTEHYCCVKDLDNSCNGYDDLLDYARKLNL